MEERTREDRLLGHVDVHGVSIRGESHDANHDRFAVADLAKSMRVHQTNLALPDDVQVLRQNQGQVFLVADGVSGGPTPALASSSAARSIVDYFLNEMPWSHLADGAPEDVTLALEDAFRNAQDELMSSANGPSQGMATTLTLAFVSWPDLYLAHVGDSRGYLARPGETRLLTDDHSLAALRKRLGGVVGEGDDNRLWNAVGGNSSQLHPQVLHIELELGDTLALLTDGVAEDLSPESVGTSLCSRASAKEACEELVSEAGTDDRTVVVARFLPNVDATVPANVESPAPTLDEHRDRPREAGTSRSPDRDSRASVAAG